eukprot:scaffold50276_cov20-Prasinocladus_malaysianus.AAC.1
MAATSCQKLLENKLLQFLRTIWGLIEKTVATVKVPGGSQDSLSQPLRLTAKAQNRLSYHEVVIYTVGNM